MFIATVAGSAIAVNPFGVPAFGLPRLTLLRVGASILAVALLLELVEGGHKVSSSAWVPLGFLVGAALLSTAFSVAPVVSTMGAYARWEGLSTLAIYWIVFASALKWGRRKVLFVWFTPALLAAAATVSLLGIAESLGLFRLARGLDLFCAAGFGSAKAGSSRIVSTCGNAAFLGGYLAMMAPLGLAVALGRNAPKPWWRPLAGGSAALAAVALLLTYTRAAWLGAALAVVVVVVVMRPTRRALLTAGIGLVAILAAAALAASASGSPSLAARLISAFEIRSGTLPQRLLIIRDTVPMVIDHWPTGVGLDAYGAVFPRYASPELLRTATRAGLANDRAHNDLLQVAATQGIVGLAAWLVFLAAYARAAVRGIRSMPDGWPRTALIGAAAATLAYLVQAQFEFSVFVSAPFFWALAGLVWASASSHSPALAPALAGGSDPASGQHRGALTPTWLAAAIAWGAPVLAAATIVVAAAAWAADVGYNRGIAGLYASDIERALDGYGLAVAANPAEPLYQASLGSALVSATMRRPAETDRLLAEAERRFATAYVLAGPDPTPYFLAANAYLEFGARRGSLELALRSIEAYEHGLRYGPRSVEALTQLGRAYAFSGRWSDARLAWERALSIKRDDPTLLAYLGRALAELGDYAGAEERHRQALAIDPRNVTAREGLTSLETSRAAGRGTSSRGPSGARQAAPR